MHWKVENGVAFANVEVNSHVRNEEAAVRIAKLSFYEMEGKIYNSCQMGLWSNT